MANFIQKITRRLSHPKSKKMISIFENWEKIKSEISRLFTPEPPKDTLSIIEIDNANNEILFDNSGCNINISKFEILRSELTEVTCGVTITYNSKTTNKCFKISFQSVYDDGIRADILDEYIVYGTQEKSEIMKKLGPELEKLADFIVLRLFQKMVSKEVDSFSNLIDFFTDDTIQKIQNYFTQPKNVNYFLHWQTKK